MNVFPAKFRFYFIKDGITTYCKYSPEEWNDNVIKWDRDKKSNSVLTKYVDSFSFVMEDADYLRACLRDINGGVFSKIRFVAEEYDSGTFTFRPYYSGDIDFYSYEEANFTVKVSMLEIGYKTAITANLDTKYEIDIPLKSDSVAYDRINLKNVVEYSCDHYSSNGCSKPSVFDSFIGIEDVYQNKIARQSVLQGEKNNDNYMFRASDNVNVTISGRFSGHAGLPMDAKIGEFRDMYVRLYVNDKIIIEDTVRCEKTLLPSPGNLPVFVIERNLDLVIGDKVYVTYHNTGGSMSMGIWGTRLNISYWSRGKTYSISGLRPIDLLSKLISKATDNRYSLVNSSILSSGEIGNMLITSGDIIRKITGAKIKTSLKDFFEAMRSMFGVYYTFDEVDNQERLVVEHINSFYNTAKQVASLDDIKDFKVKIANEYIYNRLIIGYKDNTYDEVNGRNEFNTEVEFSIDTDAKSSELKLISPYRADMYGIEFLIQEYESKDTTDSDSDDDVFVIHTGAKNEDETYRVNRSEKAQNSLAGDTAFNVYLSPKHCLLRQIEYIKSLFIFSGPVLKFTSSPKDIDMISGTGKEHENLMLNEHKGLFKPIQYEFETMVPDGISELMSKDYNGYVEVDTGNEVIKGFILSASENPGRNKSQTWKLIALE